MQLLAELCSEMDLSQTTDFGAPSEDTPLSTKTFKKLQVGLKKFAIAIVFNSFYHNYYIGSHNRSKLHGKRGTKLSRKLTTRAAK